MPAPVMVDLEDLRSAFEIASVNGGGSNQAYVLLTTGKAYFVSDDLGTQEDAPADPEDSDEYLCLQHARDFGLGQDLVFRFVAERRPEAFDAVRAIFPRRGAYARLKDLLAVRTMLDAWHRFEDASTDQALRAWCEARGLHVSINRSRWGRRR